MRVNKKINVAIVTNIITNYRKGFYDRLFNRPDVEVTVYCQDHMPGMGFTSIHKRYTNHVRIIKYISAKKEKIAWQFLPWQEIVNNHDVIFIQGNPRVLSDVVFGTYLRLTQKKVVLWTMARSFRANKVTERIRLLWSQIFPLIFVYTDKEVDYLRAKGFHNQHIIGMNNGLDQKEIDKVIQFWTDKKLNDWKRSKGFSDKTIILSCARLDPKNNFQLVLKAIPEMIKEIPNILWCIIGGGEEEDKLKKVVLELKIEDYVKFIGPLYEEQKLAPYFLSSKVFIHPAAIGLGVLHAFGYGLPLVVHGESQLHGPEYAAFTDGLTGKNFMMNDSDSLADVVVNLLNSPEQRNQIKNNAQKIARDEYNVDVMVERFIKMAKHAASQLQ